MSKTERRFGADFWTARQPTVGEGPSWGGYYDREKAETPLTHDRFGEPEDQPAQTTNWRMEFPYGA